MADQWLDLFCCFFLTVQTESSSSVVSPLTVDNLSSGRFTWTIKNFSRLVKKVYSEVFYVGGHKWWVDYACVLLLLMLVNFAHFEWWYWLTFEMSRQILLFPKGNSVDHLSLYLDVADSMTLPPGWSRFAQFCLTVVNQFNTQYSFRKGNFSVTGVSQKCILFITWIQKWRNWICPIWEEIWCFICPISWI